MQLFANMLIAGSLAALIAGGLSLVYGTLGVFNLAMGQMALFSGYITWWLHNQAGLSIFSSIFIGITTGALLSWFVFEVFINPFYKRHRFLPLVTTIALSMLLDGIILLLFEERPRTILEGSKKMLQIGSAHISLEQIIMIILTMIFLLLFAYTLHSTSVGRKIRAVVQNDHAATSLGIPAKLMHRLIFILSGILIACGGIYIGIDTNLTPTLAFGITIKAYAAVIAGGKGNFWGAIGCAYVISIIERLAVGIEWPVIGYIQGGYQESVALVIMIIILLWKPSGIFNSYSRKA